MQLFNNAYMYYVNTVIEPRRVSCKLYTHFLYCLGTSTMPTKCTSQQIKIIIQHGWIYLALSFDFVVCLRRLALLYQNKVAEMMVGAVMMLGRTTITEYFGTEARVSH